MRLLWEAYKSIAEIVKSNKNFINIYIETITKWINFCTKYKRR